MGDIRAIRTSYGHVSFRSRLEATWACFFDNCGWRWEYEPVDLPGWIPDFTLETNRGRLFVEVKPLFLRDYAVPDRHALDFRDVVSGHVEVVTDFFHDLNVLALRDFSDLHKVFDSSESWLIVGAAPSFDEGLFNPLDEGTVLGFHNQITDKGIDRLDHFDTGRTPAGLVIYHPFTLRDCGEGDEAKECGAYDRRTGSYWFPYRPTSFYRAAWARAKNTTQWRAT